MTADLEITEPGVYTDITDEQYHRDPVPGGSLSSTTARLLTKHVPAKAIEKRRHDKPTRTMILGTAAHLTVLGSGPKLIVWNYDGRTKDGKAERASVAPLIDSGAAIAVTEDERTNILGMAHALRSHPEAARILDSSHAEVSAFWREGSTWLRARYDLLSDHGAHDYKTTADVSRRGFSKAMASYGYHQQADFYERGLTALNHPAAGEPLRFICQETEPPYLVQIHTPDLDARMIARALNDRAIGIYTECAASGRWPGYPELVAEPSALPGYYFFDYDEVLPDEWRHIEQDMVIP